MADRQGIMLCNTYDEKRLKKYKKPWIVQPKIEGDRMRSIISINGELLLSSSAKDRNFALPHIAHDLSRISETIELDGEVYTHGWEHEQIRSVASRTVDRHPQHEQLGYYVFDIVDVTAQLARLEYLDHFWDDHEFEYVTKVPWYICGTIEEIEDYYKMFCDEGYEGIIIRDSQAPYVRKKTTTMMKLKPRERMHVVITGGYQEMSISGEPKNALDGFEVINAEQKAFKVGSGFKRWQREQWWPMPQKLIGKLALIHYQSITPNGIPKMQSFKEIIDNGHDSDDN